MRNFTIKDCKNASGKSISKVKKAKMNENSFIYIQLKGVPPEGDSDIWFDGMKYRAVSYDNRGGFISISKGNCEFRLYL